MTNLCQPVSLRGGWQRVFDLLFLLPRLLGGLSNHDALPKRVLFLCRLRLLLTAPHRREQMQAAICKLAVAILEDTMGEVACPSCLYCSWGLRLWSGLGLGPCPALRAAFLRVLVVVPSLPSPSWVEVVTPFPQTVYGYGLCRKYR